MWPYYRRWIQKAFERPLGVFDIFTALVAVVGGGVTHFWPAAEHLVGELAWQLPAIVLVMLVIFGVFRAPYAMHREDDAAAAGVIIERDQTIQGMFQLRLLHQPSVTFAEAASDPGLRMHWHQLTRDQFLHRLLKALWRGDFGDGDDGEGNGSLTLNGRRYGRFQAVRHVALQWGGQYGIQPPFVLLNDDNPIPWEVVRDRVRFDELAAIPPSDYDQAVLAAYFEPLRMTREAFRGWYDRLLSGKYEG